MKTFAERNPVTIGAIGVTGVVLIAAGALGFQQLPALTSSKTYAAHFAEVGGLRTGAGVDVSGYPVGKVSTIELDEKGVLITFTVDRSIHLGDRTEAAIKTKALLGSKIMDITPRGDGELTGTIPLERTVSPYQLSDALGDVTAAVSGVDTNQLSDSLSTLAQTFSGTAPDLRKAVQGAARFSETLNKRDGQLRSLLDNAAKATGVLAKRSDQVVSLVKSTNTLLAQLRTQSAALDQLWANISAVSQQLKGFIEENRTQLKPALDKLNGVLTIVDNRRERVQQAIKGLNAYAISLGESVSSGPFFKAYLANLLPGQFVQPFVDAAFSDLGLDPATKLPSQLTEPPVGQPGTPPLPVPFPRTGQGGEPRLTVPDAITGNLDPNLPAQFPGRYPYREPLPAPPPDGPPPGPPAPPPPGLEYPSKPTHEPVHVPAPGEVPAMPSTGGNP